jgi:UTP--glucose-1-phosphate uridylyltransferase
MQASRGSMSTPHFPGSATTIHKAVVPAAGLGTRLRPLTDVLPKELLPVGRKPVLAHIAAELRGAGITDALFIVSDRKPQIRAFFGDTFPCNGEGDPEQRLLPPLRCAYVTQQSQRGLGDALLYAEEWADRAPFAVAFGDCIIDAPDPSEPLRRLLDLHRSRAADATVLAETVAREQVFRYGVVAPASDRGAGDEQPFIVRDIVEKPAPEDAPSNLVVAARWVLGARIFDLLRAVQPDSRDELSLTDAVRALARAGGAVWASPLHRGEYRRDIGNFETFFSSFIRAALRDGEYGESARKAAGQELSSQGARAE